MPRFLTAVIAFSGFCSLANAQQNSHPATLEPLRAVVQTIDFQLSPHNNTVVKTTLNGTAPCDLMLHTAVDSVSLIESRTPKLKSAQFSHEGNTVAQGCEQTSRHVLTEIPDRNFAANFPATKP